MLLQTARECRDSLADFRRKRDRCRDYTFGRQWNDIIEVNGKLMTEYDYIISEGNVPLKNNLIRRIVRNVLGVFRERLPDLMKETYHSGDDAPSLKEIAGKNSLTELFCRGLEEFLISGMVVHKKRIGSQNGVNGVWTEAVSPDSFFFNTDSRDLRGWDLNIIGQEHKVDFNDWCRAFVKKRDDYRRACSIFDRGVKKVKVTEIWRREMAPVVMVHDRMAGFLRKFHGDKLEPSSMRQMPHKWSLEEIWRFYFLSEDGTVLLSGDSPYMHRSHPYVMKCYPFLDGEIHSFVGDMIDQQRYTNRLITLYDWVIRASAKGVLLLPEDCVDPNNYQAVADQWSRFNGVIVYKSQIGVPEPKQVSGSMSNLGISELLEIQLKMMEDVSGVNGILQGKTSGANVSGALYNSQTTNAMYSLADLLESYGTFIRESAGRDRILSAQAGI